MADAASSMSFSFDYENFVQDLSNCLQLPELENPVGAHQPVKPQFAAADAAAVLVNELACAANMEDATLRATKLLEEFEIFIRTRAVEQEIIKEREENEGLRRVNVMLKRAVVIQHERQKKFEELKKLVKEYEEQVKKLEVDKYSLSIHLKLAQNATSIPRTLHPDVF